MLSWRKFVGGAALFVLFWALSAGNATASFCGIAHKCHRHCCHCGCACQCCVVMKMCCETVMVDQESTTWETVYEEVKDKKPVNVTKYVPETNYECIPSTIYQPAPTKSCEPVCPPVGACPPAGDCPQPTVQELAPCQVCRKVPVTGFRAETKEEMVEVPRITAKLVPHTITLCIPTVVWKLVPVQVCCPVPCCCGCGCGCGS